MDKHYDERFCPICGEPKKLEDDICIECSSRDMELCSSCFNEEFRGIKSL